MKQTISPIKRDIVNELHKPARKIFNRRHVVVKGLRDLYQVDLIEMIPYARVNKGFRYILIVIDVFSKYVWAFPVRRKTAEHVVEAMAKVFTSPKNIPKNVQSDEGTEFYNSKFENLMKKYKINHYSSFSPLKCSVVERVNRTLKNMMYKEFSLQGSYDWLNLLPKIVRKYNNTNHSTIKMKPVNVNKKNEKRLLKSVYGYLKVIDRRKSKFKVGDFVRISKYRHVFSKSYKPNWTNEIFKIVEIKETNPRTYILEDENKEIILGGFYSEEIQKVKHPDAYLIERILQRKGNKMRVKWLGINTPTWINSNDVV